VVDGFTGPVHVEWDREEAFTLPLPFFVELGGPVRCFSDGLPAELHEPERARAMRCPGYGDVAMLAGHKRYAHITALRLDEVLPARREPNRPCGRGAAALATIEEAGAVWLRNHLDIALSRFWLRPDSQRSYDKAVTYRALTSSLSRSRRR
jgi:hypothetical protein